MFDVSLFLRLFHPRISFSVLLTVLAIAIAATRAVLAFTNIRKYRNIILVWLIACLYLMFHIAIFGRESREFYSLHLIPFWSIVSIQNGFVETLYEKLNNILFFIPFGCLLGTYFKEKVISRSLIIGTVTSITIELLQLITKTGTCETDDVICNTVGCVVGAVIGIVLCRLIGKKKEMNR